MDIKQELKNLKPLRLLIKDLELEDMPSVTNGLIAEMNKTLEKIHDLKDNEEVKVMLLRYSEGMTWDEVANAVNYSYSKVLSIHKRAMAKLTRA